MFFLATACSQNKKPSNEAIFVTHITEQGDKKFQYSQQYKSNKGSKGQGGKGNRGSGQGPSGGGKSGARGGKGGSGRGSDERSSDQRRGTGDGKQGAGRLRKHIEKKLNETGYCREGFFEVDHYNDEGRLYFNGQCNEKATKEDRIFFK